MNAVQNININSHKVIYKIGSSVIHREGRGALYSTYLFAMYHEHPILNSATCGKQESRA